MITLITNITKIGRHKFYPYCCLLLVTAAYFYTNPLTEFEFRYLFSFLGAVSGLVCVILLAKRKNSGNVIGILAGVTEPVANYLGGNIGASLPSFFYISSHVYGLFTWNKNQNKDKKVNVKTITEINYLFVLIFLICAIYVNIYITSLSGIENNPYQLITNCLIFGLGITAQLLLMLRFSLTWYIWLLLNVLVIGLNIHTDNIVMATQYLIYLFNAIFGLIEWKFNIQEQEKTE